MKFLVRSVAVLSFILLLACSEQASESSAQTPQSVVGPVSNGIAMDIYKSPTCGCCGKWVEHAEQRGISLTTHHPADLNKLKAEHGIAPEYQSCHTVVSAEGYVFEGHIPARFIHAFLAEPPADALGLAVPAMPLGSPGMEMEDRFSPYTVLLLKRDGSTQVFAEVSTPAQQY
ncbi:MAG: DUF411 domain-containing protein [Gammaproteobacteria bacterium]|nr:DUF411 domain-containing protein [Gammaproteobacteria bacterium]MBQ0838343.1 DUF411 domain-containing protein [Gammaproteobacteria bacterium]